MKRLSFVCVNRVSTFKQFQFRFNKQGVVGVGWVCVVPGRFLAARDGQRLGVPHAAGHGALQLPHVRGRAARLRSGAQKREKSYGEFTIISRTVISKKRLNNA